MAGNKNSGRRSNANEALRLRVLDKAWVILEAALDDPHLNMKEKLEIAKSLAVKSIPTEHSGSVNANVTAMGTVEKALEGGGVEVIRYNIGVDLETEPPQDT